MDQLCFAHQYHIAEGNDELNRDSCSAQSKPHVHTKMINAYGSSSVSALRLRKFFVWNFIINHVFIQITDGDVRMNQIIYIDLNEMWVEIQPSLLLIE